MIYRFFFSVLLVCIKSSSLTAQTDQTRENNLKAYFVYTKAKYVEWEDIDKDSDFVVGCVGSESTGQKVYYFSVTVIPSWFSIWAIIPQPPKFSLTAIMSRFSPSLNCRISSSKRPIVPRYR